MDLMRIAVRAVFAFVVLLLLVRVSGKRTIAQGTAFDFTVALIVGDLIDDALWAEVEAATFVIASAVIVTAHAMSQQLAFAGRRR